jgi:hypothetical protein
MSNILRRIRRSIEEDRGPRWQRGDASDKTGCRRRVRATRTGSALDALRSHPVEPGKVAVAAPGPSFLSKIRAFFTGRVAQRGT